MDYIREVYRKSMEEMMSRGYYSKAYLYECIRRNFDIIDYRVHVLISSKSYL